MRVDLPDLARRIAEDQGLHSLEPVIEKEIVHQEVLRALSEHGLLSSLTFQGGTCLRLCYGSARMSEDLDFAAGKAFDALDLDAFGAALKGALARTYDVAVRVREPKVSHDPSGIGIRRWTVIVDTAPERPDLPSQRVKVEVASVPAYTAQVRQVRLAYPELPATYAQALVRCEEPEEIMSDKLLSFANSTHIPRHRDLWDIPWIASMPGLDMALVADLFGRKAKDYGCAAPLAELLNEAVARAGETIRSEAFSSQMRRFLPPALYDGSVARPGGLDALARRVEGSYRRVAHELGVAVAPEEAHDAGDLAWQLESARSDQPSKVMRHRARER